MYRPKRTFSKGRAGRILRGICACFFAALVIGFMIIPAKEIQAAGKVYPVEAFNGTWDFEDTVTNSTQTLTIQINGDGTIDYTNYALLPPDEVFKDGLETILEWHGTYTYNTQTGELRTEASSDSWAVGMGGTMTETYSWYLIDIDTLEGHLLQFDGLKGQAVDRFYRSSETPAYADEEEEVATAEESLEEEAAEEEQEESEAEEPEEEATDEEETVETEESAEDVEQTAEEPVENQDQLLTDEEAETLLVSIFEGDDEHLNQAKTAAAAAGMTLGGFVSALLAAGTLGGAPTPPTVDGGGVVPAGDGPGNMGPGVTMDSDGDIHYRNPITGEESVYTSNGDGTYKNVLTGVEVTVKDINDRANYEFDNAAEIGLEQEKLAQWQEEQREANSQLSREAQQAALDKIRQEEYLKEQDRKNQIMYNRGIFDGDEKAFKKAILQERQEETRKFGEYAAAGEYWDAATKTAENVKKGADIAIDVMAEIEPTGAGKSIKNGYKFLSEAAGQGGKVMAGKQSLKQAIGKTIVNGALNYVKDNVPNNEYSNELKCLANVTGNGTAAYINTRIIDGKSHEEALKKASDAAKEGLADVAVDYAVGKVMDGVTEGVEIKDNKVFNGIYNNNNVNGSSISKLGLKSQKSGFTKAVVKNDRFKEGGSALVGDLIKLTYASDDDD